MTTQVILWDWLKANLPPVVFFTYIGESLISVPVCFAAAVVATQVMLWDWLKANLPGYLTLPRLNSPDVAAPATPAAAAAAQPAAASRAVHGGRSMGRA
jgi:hypothetical protein